MLTSHHRAAVGPPEVPLKHPVVEADPLVIAAQACRDKPDVRLLPGAVGGQNCTSRRGEASTSPFHLSGQQRL